jgi:hypothetical protein
MKRAKAFVAFLGVSLVLGCAPIPKVTLKEKFSAAEVAWFNKTGTAKLVGSAVVRTVGGASRTCAGTAVQLIPAGKYADERMQVIYGSTTRGYATAFGRKGVPAENDPGYMSLIKETVCGADGVFEFEDLPAGDYFVISQVTWTVGNSFIPEGGRLMQRVNLVDGKTKKIVMAP